MPRSKEGEIIIKGIPALTRRLNWEPKLVEKGIKKASRAVGLLVQREARRNAPFDEGDLERGITFQVIDGGVRVYVPINTPAGKYAERMHNGEYNRGPGTVSKGPRADRKYITRAVNDNDEKIHSLFKAVLGSVG